MNQSKRSVKINDVVINLDDLDMKKLTHEQNRDIEEIERELSEKRHYTSTNRWIPTGDIKNGYVIGDKHTRLISDAAALDYIVF